MAWRFCAKAESETSAHTGRLTSLRGLFCVRAMDLPNELVYDIQSPQAGGHTGCRVKGNTWQTACEVPQIGMPCRSSREARGRSKACIYFSFQRRRACRVMV